MAAGTRLAARWTALSLGVGLALAALELGASAWLRHGASEPQRKFYATFAEQTEGASLWMQRHPFLPYVPTPGYVHKGTHHNSLGFRGPEFAVPKPDGTRRIAMVGGSTTYTLAVDEDAETYPALVQADLEAAGLPIEVINGGVPMYTTFDSLLNLPLRVLEAQPDVVLIYHGINDLWTRTVEPGAYVRDNRGARQPYVPKVETVWDHSVALRIARTELGMRDPHMGQGFFVTHGGVPTAFGADFQRQMGAGSYPSGRFVQTSVGELFAANPPTWFAANLASMVGISQAHGALPVLMTFASSGQMPKFPALAHPDVRAALAEQNQVVRDLAVQLGVPCIDLERSMPEDPTLWVDGMHVNEAGARKKATLVSEALLPLLVESGSDGPSMDLPPQP